MMIFDNLLILLNLNRERTISLTHLFFCLDVRVHYNKGRETAEIEKNKKIKEAEQLLAKEKGEATTEEEIKAAEARFKARKEAAEKGLQDELDFQDQLAELQETGTKEEIDALKAKYAQIKKLNDEADAARLKDIDEQLALEKALRAKAEAERQAEIAKQVEEEKKRAQEAIDRLEEEGSKRKEEIKNQIKAENREFEAAEKERNEKIARAIAEVSAGLQLASSQLSDYVTNLAKSLGLAADKIKPIADAIAQINSATKTNSTSSSSTSDPSSNPSNPSNPSNNPFSSPTQGDNNGSAGNLGFNVQQAPNTNQGNQNNNSPSSSPASPNNSPASSNNSPSGPSSNTGISASANQANQNSQSQDQAPPPPNDPDQQGGDGDGNTGVDGFGRPKLASEYHKASTDLYISFKEKAKGLKPKKFDELVAKHYDAALALANTYTIETFKGLSNTDENGVILTSESFYQEGYSKALQSIFNGLQEKNSIKYYAFGVNKIIEFVEYTRKRLKPLPNKNGLGSGLNDKPPTIDSGSPGDINSPSSRGNNPSPRGPGSTNPVKPNIPNSGGLTDKEKAVFAGRDKDAENGEGEGASKKGFVPVAPNAAVGGGNAGNAGTNQAGQSQNQSQNPFGSNEDPNDTSNGFDGVGQGQTINQTNNSSITNNYYLSGILTDKKTQDEIMSLMQKREEQVQQEMQQKLRNLAGPNLLR